MKKKWMVFVCLLCLSAVSWGCSGGGSGASTETETQAVDAAKNGDAKILTVYFTMPETDGIDAVSGASRIVENGDVVGNTQFVAQQIQDTAGGDLFQIETTKTYPGDHDALVDEASQEQDEDARPELSSEIDNFDQYDVVFVGYPNWWGDMPQAMYTFFDTYDFSGKTIIPFVTHGGSGFSDTISSIETLEPDAEVVSSGLSIARDDVADAGGDIKTWVEDLGFAK